MKGFVRIKTIMRGSPRAPHSAGWAVAAAALKLRAGKGSGRVRARAPPPSPESPGAEKGAVRAPGCPSTPMAASDTALLRFSGAGLARR